jgi:hypothetical protein
MSAASGPDEKRGSAMQMIDVYAPAGVFDDKHQLARDLAAEVMLIERGSDVVLLRENTAAFIHEFPNDSMANVDGASDCVRVQVLTNVDALDPSERIAMVARLRAVIAGAPGNPPPAWRVGVLFTQASEGDGGWGATLTPAAS